MPLYNRIRKFHTGPIQQLVLKLWFFEDSILSFLKNGKHLTCSEEESNANVNHQKIIVMLRCMPKLVFSMNNDHVSRVSDAAVNPHA